MSDRRGHGPPDDPPTHADFHSESCEFVDGGWRCAPDCVWGFTGLDFARGDLVVSVHQREGRIVVTVTADGDPHSPRAVEVAECGSPRKALLLQQALMLLLEGRGGDGDP